MKNIWRNYRSSTLANRLTWMVGIVFVYMLGKYIPIATLPVAGIEADAYKLDSALENLAMVTGGQFSTLNLFSLGLSPWMTGMILWRFLTLFKTIKGLTAQQSHRYRMLLMFIVALIQSIGVSSLSEYYQFSQFGDYSLPIVRGITMVVMITGSFVLMWLANVNGRKGLGGPSVIIVSNMILTFIINIIRYFSEKRLGVLEFLLTIAVIALIASALIWITVVVYRAEYRIPIRRIMIISAFAESTYIPIRVTPAGGMPFMYAMTLMSLPPILISALLQIFPENPILKDLVGKVSISELLGILVYIFLLFILAIGFAYFNIDPTEVAENMQKSGDYIENVRPGEATRKYISFYLNRLTLVGAIYTCLMGGVPLILVWSQQGQISIALLINNIYIVTTLLLGIVEQVRILRSWREYDEII
ncbi:accessory Sec system protein translocase subunit SecY2 [Streptococcus suis]